MKSNILYIIDGLKSGGKERQLLEIVKNIDRKQFNVGIITFNDHQHYTSEIRNNVSYFRILKKRPTRFEPVFTIWQCFHEFKPDIVHTWDSLSSFYAYLPCKYNRVKLIDGSIRDAGVDKGWEYSFKRFFLKRADCVISNSKAGLKAYNITGQVIYNVIDKSRFHPVTLTEEFNIIMTANFTDYKDHQTFINAAIMLVEDRTVDNVYLLGDGPYRQKYINLLMSKSRDIQDKFHFPGVVFNAEEYLAKCKIGVLCSTPEYSEGLSNAVLEYMAAGLVSIVTDLGGSSEIIENEKNGYLILPGDTNKIVELVHLLKSNKHIQEHIIVLSINTITENFSMKKNMKRLCLFYKSSLSN